MILTLPARLEARLSAQSTALHLAIGLVIYFSYGERHSKLQQPAGQSPSPPPDQQYVTNVSNRPAAGTYCFKERVSQIRRDPARHPLRKELLKVELLPYQLDGIAFAVGGRPGDPGRRHGPGQDDPGRGRGRDAGPRGRHQPVLVVCPASLKSQWRNEIHRFSDRNVQLVIGGAAERAEQYDNDCFFTVCNYEQVLRDILAIERVRWDLIILDEGQRIKNWESKTSPGHQGPEVAVRPGAVSGTPLENRLDELYSVVQFVDDRRLPPGLPLLPPPPRGGREGQGAGLQEPRPVAREPAADPAAAARASRCCSSCRRGPPRSSASRPPTSRSNCTARTCGSCRMITRKTYHHRDGPAAAAEGPADVPHVGRQHVPGRQADARLFQQAGIPGRAARRTVRRAGPQGPAVLRVDHDARPDRADADASASWTTCGWTARCRRRSGSNWSTASRTIPTAGCSSPPTPARRA